MISSGNYGVLENRKKLDGFQVINNGNTWSAGKVVDVLWHKEEKHIQSESKCDMRKSLAWDSAFFTSPGVLDPDELFEALNFRDEENTVDACEKGEKKPLSSVSLEPEITNRIGECNFRRSLAWDSAFFTSPGVLDPEELSLVNKGFKKSETCVLPKIEEISRSVESNAVVGCGCFSLANLEIALFDDIRLSSRQSSMESNDAASNDKLERGQEELDAFARRRMKSTTSSRRQSTITRGVERISKENSLTLQGQHAIRSAEFNLLSSLKTPKILRRAKTLSTAPTKRTSSGPNYVKMEKRSSKAACGQGTNVLKKPCVRHSSNVIPGSTPLPTLCSSGSLSIGSESAGSDSAPLDSTGKSHPTFLCNANLGLAASDSSFDTPRHSTGSSETVSSSQQSHFFSMLRSSSTLPARLSGGWSTESTSQDQRLANSTAILDVNPFTVASFDSEASKVTDSESDHTDLPCVGQKSQEERLLVDKNSLVTKPLPTNTTSNVKFSGLRTPSPKIGFFDAESPSARTPNGGLKSHSGVQSICRTKSHLSNPNGRTVIRKYTKQQSAGSLTGTGSKKLSSQESGGPHPLLGISCPAKASASSAAKKSHVATTSRVQKYLCELGGGKRSRDIGPECSAKSEDNRTKRTLRNQMGANSDRKVNLSTAKKQSSRQCDSSGMYCPKNSLQILHDEDKENTCRLEIQVDDLSKHMETMNIRGDLLTKLKGSSRHSIWR